MFGFSMRIGFVLRVPESLLLFEELLWEDVGNVALITGWCFNLLFGPFWERLFQLTHVFGKAPNHQLDNLVV